MPSWWRCSIGRGADQGVRDKSGKTAFDLAANESVRRTLSRPAEPLHNPARYSAIAAISLSEIDFIRSDMPGLLPRLPSRKSSMVWAR